ncbi:MAG: hypothetical protein JWP35_3494 [Caulobacter sp.]|nr:hypothetical protein [Caulobacter sp.]
MAHPIKRLILPLLIFLSALTGGAAQARPAMWVVRDADSTIVLFGSIHVLPAGLDWRSPELDAAIAGADDLWFETPMDPISQGQVSRLAYQKGQLRFGRHLSELLTPVGRERLARLVARLGLWAPDLDKMEPWLADVTLTLAALERQGAGGSQGVEQQIEQLAPVTAQRRAFENGGQQVDFFHRLPLREQALSLEQTLEELDTEPGAYRTMVDAWMAGDLGVLQRYGDERLKAVSPLLYKRLVTERNERWTRIIMRRLAGHGASVMVVGAGHLVGPDGAPARLRALGVTVEGP